MSLKTERKRGARAARKKAATDRHARLKPREDGTQKKSLREELGGISGNLRTVAAVVTALLAITGWFFGKLETSSAAVAADKIHDSQISTLISTLAKTNADHGALAITLSSELAGLKTTINSVGRQIDVLTDIIIVKSMKDSP